MYAALSAKQWDIFGLTPQTNRRHLRRLHQRAGDQCLCPLNNYWYPSIKITGKIKLENGRYKKVYDKPKTPYQRLRGIYADESPDVSQECKDELSRRKDLYNPVVMKRFMDAARDRLLKINREKSSMNSAPVSEVLEKDFSS
jgi:hypothetical protein